MKLFTDIISGDEMFSDTYKIKLVDHVIYEVTGKLVQRRDGEIVLEGSNPSQEEADEGTEFGTTSGVDIVLNHRLVETFAFDKKGYTAYLKDYMKKLLVKIKETNPDQESVFKDNMTKVIKDLLPRFKDFQLFTGESMDVDGMVAIMEYRDIGDDNVPIMMFFKHGLLEQKL